MRSKTHKRPQHLIQPHRRAQRRAVSARCLVTVAGAAPAAAALSSPGLLLLILTTSARAVLAAAVVLRTSTVVLALALAARAAAVLLLPSLREERERKGVRVGDAHRSRWWVEGTGRTLGPLYRLFWYFSASLIQEVWPLNSPGLLKVEKQSMQVTAAWHIW